MDFALGKVNARADVALPTGLRQVLRTNHRPWIGRRQDVMDTVATGAISDDFRSQLRSQTVITVFVTTDASARDAEFLS